MIVKDLINFSRKLSSLGLSEEFSEVERIIKKSFLNTPNSEEPGSWNEYADLVPPDEGISTWDLKDKFFELTDRLTGDKSFDAFKELYKEIVADSEYAYDLDDSGNLKLKSFYDAIVKKLEDAPQVSLPDQIENSDSEQIEKDLGISQEKGDYLGYSSLSEMFENLWVAPTEESAEEVVEKEEVEENKDGSESKKVKEKRTRRKRVVKAGNTYHLPEFSFEVVPCVTCAEEAIIEAEDSWQNGFLYDLDPQTVEAQRRYWEFTNKNNSAFYNNLTHPRGKDRWMDYKWIYKGDKDAPKKVEHWSAAFVSFIMAKADGEGANWYVYESHTGYIRNAKKVRRQIEKDPDSHIGNLYYVYFSKSEFDEFGLEYDLGDVIGRGQHMDIIATLSPPQLIGGNTGAKNDDIYERSGGERRSTRGDSTSGLKPMSWNRFEGIIKRIRVVERKEEALV